LKENRSNNTSWSELLDFLNTNQKKTVLSEDFSGRTIRVWLKEDLDREDVRIFLRECVAVMSDARLDWFEARKTIEDKAKLREWEWKRSRALWRAINKLWSKETYKSIPGETLHPGDFKRRVRWVDPGQIHLEINLWEKLLSSRIEDFQDFSFGILIEGGPASMVPGPKRYILQFLEMLSDPQVGATRLVKCQYCGKIQIGRTNQKCCPDESGTTSCRVKWHYKQDPEKKKAQVKRWREKNPGMG